MKRHTVSSIGLAAALVTLFSCTSDWGQEESPAANAIFHRDTAAGSFRLYRQVWVFLTNLQCTEVIAEASPDVATQH